MGINLIDIALIMKDNSKNAFACHRCKSFFLLIWFNYINERKRKRSNFWACDFLTFKPNLKFFG